MRTLEEQLVDASLDMGKALLLAGGEETAEGRRSSGAGIEFETMQCDH